MTPRRALPAVTQLLRRARCSAADAPRCADDTVDLWLEDDFNAPSRMPAGRPYGARENVAWSGKEAADADVAVNTVSITCVGSCMP